MKRDWTDKIREKMDGYEQKAPQGLLEEVFAAVEKRENKKRRKKNIFLWSSIAGAAAVIIALFLLFPEERLQLNRETTNFADNSREWEHRNTAAAKKEKPQEEKRQEIRDERKNIPHSSSMMAAVASRPSPEKSNKEEQLEEKNSKENKKEETNKEEQIIKKEKGVLNRSRELPQNANFCHTSPRRSGTVRLGLFAANASTNSGKGEEQAPIMLSDAALTSLPKFSDHPYRENEESGILKNEKDIKTSSKHKMPVRAGISVAYQWSPRWSIASGLTYTYLESEITKESRDYKQEYTQKLHYLGIPVELQYRINPEKRLQIYLTAGGRMEKCISGKEYGESQQKGKESIQENITITEKPLQFSAKAGIGMEYRISKHIGIYVEPGLSYYFNNGSSIENIYKDRPLNFQVAGGLRFSISK